jgi:uncharacterized membrane protein
MADQAGDWLYRHWFLILNLFIGLFVGLPFLAPVFMYIGWHIPARIIYTIYSFLCHQLPQRSFFLFGPKLMYSLSEIQTVVGNTTSPHLLRQFIGNSEKGWKVAWSDRMVFMYSSLLLFAWLWWVLRKRVRPIPLWGLILLLLPMGVDGITHFISDLSGLGEGFRYSNQWLATLTHNAFPTSFYVGNGLGSFNSWMRLVTGVLFGLGLVWYALPYLQVGLSLQVTDPPVTVNLSKP